MSLVTLGPSKIHGQGLHTSPTTTTLPPGTLLHTESPLFHIPKILTQNTDSGYHLTNQVLKATLSEGTPEQKRGFLGLWNGWKHKPTYWDLAKRQRSMDPLSGIFLSNCLETLESHRINHSCTPNAHASYNPTKKTLQIYSLVPLAPSTEILLSYIDPTLPLSERQHQLWSQWRFFCRCDVCALGLGDVLEDGDERLVQLRQSRSREEGEGEGDGDGDDPSIQTTLPGPSLAASALSELHRKRVRVFRSLLVGWEERKVPAWTVVKFSKQVLDKGGVCDMEGLGEGKGEMWEVMGRVAAAHHSITLTRLYSQNALSSLLISHGPLHPSLPLLRQTIKDPRKHPWWERRDKVDFDSGGGEEVGKVLGWEGEGRERRNKRKKKKGKKGAAAAASGVDGEGGNGAAVEEGGKESVEEGEEDDDHEGK
ncbi:hypothetical protein T439DRAFT_363607 [Meredithblackwellia eburnea MCA 4105]